MIHMLESSSKEYINSYALFKNTKNYLAHSKYYHRTIKNLVNIKYAKI